MARDYARYKVRAKPSRIEKGWPTRLLISVLAVGVAGILIFGMYAYKTHRGISSKHTWAARLAQMKVFLGHKKTSALLSTKILPISETHPDSDVRFNFYNELPNMQVTLSDTEEGTDKKTVSPKPSLSSSLALKEFKQDKKNAGHTSQYILQLGVFNNETAAGQARVSLLLAGCEADIVKSIAGNRVIYRVQKGPYATVAQVKEIQKQIRNKGIMSFVVETS
ncbi:MAG: hypothetical protein K0S27_394 [Gammaproteobacteria bacterium]|jgi:hypothetical protein|nr:hypothetical protein [Gammaproteobacteria bacterium]